MTGFQEERIDDVKRLLPTANGQGDDCLWNSSRELGRRERRVGRGMVAASNGERSRGGWEEIVDQHGEEEGLIDIADVYESVPTSHRHGEESLSRGWAGQGQEERPSWQRYVQMIKYVDQDGVIRRQIRDDICGGGGGLSRRKASLAGVILCFCMLFSLSSFRRAGHAPPTTKQKLMSAAALCAGGGDLFDPRTHLCKMEDTLAFASFAAMPWASCDTSMPGAAALQGNMDEQGTFWYPYRKRDDVDAFYKSCKPVCASSKDWYDRSYGVCVSADKLLNAWTETCQDAQSSRSCVSTLDEGLYCDRHEKGISVLRITHAHASISTAPPRDMRVSYLPQNSEAVRDLAVSCRPLCADGDKVSDEAGRTCTVQNGVVLRALRGGRDAGCDFTSPGARYAIIFVL